MIKSPSPMTPAELRTRLFVSPREAAIRVFGIDPRSVRAAIARGEIPAVRVGRQLMIPSAALAEMAERRATGQPNPEAG